MSISAPYQAGGIPELLIDPEEKTPSSPVDLLKGWRHNLHIVALGHFLQADSLSKLHLELGIPAVILSTVTGTSVFASLVINATPWAKITVGTIGLLAAVLSGLQTFFSVL